MNDRQQNIEKLEEIAAAYYLGALEAGEKRAFEVLLARNDPIALKLREDYQQITQLLPFTVLPASPPPTLKENIITLIDPPKPPGEAPVGETAGAEVYHLEASLQNWKKFAWGMVAALLLTLMAGVWYVDTLRSDIEAMKLVVVENNRELDEARLELALQKQVMAVAQSPTMQIVPLASLPAAPPSARANILYAPELDRAVLLAHDLPAPPEDRDYQLWILHGNQPIDAGLLKMDRQGNFTVEVRNIDRDQWTAFAVTLEPKGGVPSPTGAMYLLGQRG